MAIGAFLDKMSAPAYADGNSSLNAQHLNSSEYNGTTFENNVVANSNNSEIAEQTFQELILHSDFGYLVLMLFICIAWIIFISLFSSRCWGLLVSSLVSRLLKPVDGSIWEFNLRSVEISFIAGKLMFGGLQIITQDYRLYINDGYVMFRWWWRYEPPAFEEYEKCPSRLLVYVSGVDFYLYNSYEQFRSLEQRYNETISVILSGGHGDEADGTNVAGVTAVAASSSVKQQLTNDEVRRGSFDWRAFCPVIEFEAQFSRLVFGNGNAPSLLAASTELFRMHYTVTTASDAADPLMHVMDGIIKSCRIGFLPSPDYRGGTAERVSSLFEPTQVVRGGYQPMFECERLTFKHCIDQAADKIPNQIGADDVESAASPLMNWNLDLTLSKKATLLYSPWADEQRDLIYRSLLPVDRLPGKPSSFFDRQYEALVIKIKTEDVLDLTVSFTGDNKGREERLYLGFGSESWIEMRIPWITGPAGITASFASHVEKLSSSTTMPMSKLIESDTLDLKFDLHFPLVWNAPQIWEIGMNFSKTTAHVLFYHKDFLRLLLEDWGNQRYADILRHVPFTMRFRIHFEDFELVTFVNEHNWVDCPAKSAGEKDENAYLAVCGAHADLDFQLPLTDFMPESMLSRVTLTADTIDLKILLPESNTHYYGLLSLYKSARIRSPVDSSAVIHKIHPSSEWSNITSGHNWMCCWSAGAVSIDINYRLHPLPLLKPGQELCGPSRGTWRQKLRQLAVDEATVHVTLTNSQVFLSGALVRYIYIFKSNYFGIDDHFTSMQRCQADAGHMKTNEIFEKLLKMKKSSTSTSKKFEVDESSAPSGDGLVNFDDENPAPSVMENDDTSDNAISLKRIREARPINAFVSLIVRGVEVHLLRHCDSDAGGEAGDSPCPSACIESIHLEVDKKYLECKIQVVLFPVLLCVSDTVWRPTLEKWCGEGQLLLTFFQYRAHAYFSDYGMPLGHDTTEYGWLQDLQLGDILGRLSAPQLYELISCIETLAMFIQNDEDELQKPAAFQECHHLQLQPVCTIFDSKKSSRVAAQSEATASPMRPDSATADELCPTAEDVKYSMLRVSVDAVQLHVSESHAALVLDVNKLWLAQCNLFNKNTAGCCNIFLPHAVVHQFVRSDQLSSSAADRKSEFSWLEAGSIDFGAIECVFRMQQTMNAKKADSMTVMQREFLFNHDKDTHRLYFLHASELNNYCGCYGGCKFFGCHYSPQLESMLRPAFRPGHEREAQQLWQGHSLLHPGWNIFPRKPSGILRTLISVDNDEEDAQKKKLSVPNLLASQSVSSSSRRGRPSSQEIVKNSNVVQTKTLAGASQLTQPPNSQLNGHVTADIQIPIIETTTSRGHVRKMSSVSGGESFYSAYSGNNEDSTRNSSRRSSTHIMPASLSAANQAEEFVWTNERGFHPVVAGEIDLTLLAGNSAPHSSARGMQTLQRRGSTVSSVTISASETSENRVFDLETDMIAARVENAADIEADGENAREFYPKDAGDGDNGSLTAAGDDNRAATTSHTTSSSENIDLRYQMTIPVLDSPMLMAGYRSVLSQFQCSFCSFRLFSNNSSTTNNDAGNNQEAVGISLVPFSHPTVTAVLPVFKSVLRGEAARFQAVDKKKQQVLEPVDEKFTLRSHFGSADYEQARKISAEVDESQTSIEIFVRKTIVLHLSPLSVEAVNACIETLDPVTSRYRPLSVVNNLYSLCLGDARGKTSFDENLYAAQRAIKAFASPNEGLQEANLLSPGVTFSTVAAVVGENSRQVLSDAQDNAKYTDTSSYNEVHNSACAFSLNMKAVSISFVQVGIADEIVNLSYLDNPLDILCMSSLMLGVDSLRASSLVKSDEKRFVLLHERSKNGLDYADAAKKRPFLNSATNASANFLQKRFRTDATDAETNSKFDVSSSPSNFMLSLLPNAAGISNLYTKSHVTTSLVATAAIEHVHLQLRRILTPGISARQCSRTQISCINDADSSCWFATAENSGELSFLMMETGIEKLNLQGYRRSGTASTLPDDVEKTGDAEPTSTSKAVPMLLVHESMPSDVDIEQQNEIPPTDGNENLANNVENFNEDEDVSISSASAGDVENDDNFSVRIEREQVIMRIIDDSAATPPPVVAPSPADAQNFMQGGDAPTTVAAAVVQPKDVSSWTMSIGSTWLNLPTAAAAASREKQIDDASSSSSNDWHFQTTLLPAVWAWLTPSRRLSEVSEKLLNDIRQRRLAVISCILASALDSRLQTRSRRSSLLLLPPLSLVRRQRITLHALALRQDTSCRLLRILRKFLFEIADDLSDEITKSFKRENVPPSEVMEQGVAVLLHEWKKLLFASAARRQTNLPGSSSTRRLLNNTVALLATNSAAPATTRASLNVMPSPGRAAVPQRTFLAPIHEFGSAARRRVAAANRRFYVDPEGNQADNVGQEYSGSVAVAARFAQQQHHATQYGSTSRIPVADPTPAAATAGAETDADELMQNDLYNYLQHEKQQFMTKPMYAASNTANDLTSAPIAASEPLAFAQQHRRRHSTASSAYSRHSSLRPPSSGLKSAKLFDFDEKSVLHSFANHIGLDTSSGTKNITTASLLELTKHVGMSCKIMLSLNELKLELIESCIIRPTQRNLLLHFEENDSVEQKSLRRRWCAFSSGGLKCDARLSATLFGDPCPPNGGNAAIVADFSREPTFTLQYNVTLGNVVQAVDLATIRVLLQVITLVSKMMNESRYSSLSAATTKRGQRGAVTAQLARSSSLAVQRRQQQKRQKQSLGKNFIASDGGFSPAISLTHIPAAPSSSISDSTPTNHHGFFADGAEIDVAATAAMATPAETGDAMGNARYSSLVHEHTPRCWKRLYLLMDLANNSETAAATAVGVDAMVIVNEQPQQPLRQQSFSRFRRRPTATANSRAANETAFGREISIDLAAANDLSETEHQQNSSFFSQPYFQQQTSNDFSQRFESAPTLTTGQQNYSHNLMPLVLSQTRAMLKVSGYVRLEAIQLNANVLGLKLAIAVEDCNLVPTYCMLKPKKLYMIPSIHAKPESSAAHTINTLSVSAGVGKLLLRLLEDDNDAERDAVKRTKSDKNAAADHRRSSILSIRIGPCSANYSKAYYAKRLGTLKHVASIGIDAIRISLPQNPALVHSLVTKRSENLTTTIDELRRFTAANTTGGAVNPPQTVNNEADTWVAHHHSTLLDDNEADAAEYYTYYADEANPAATHAAPLAMSAAQRRRTRPSTRQHRRGTSQITDDGDDANVNNDLPILVNAQIRELRLESSVLPSLKAVYHMPEALAFGLVATSGNDSSASLDIPKHSLSFVSKVNPQYNLAPSARFDLPDLTVSICYGPAPFYEALLDASDLNSIQPVRANGMLRLFVTIGSPEYRITTDLLNYVILIQSVFMQELRDVIDKITSSASSSSSRASTASAKKKTDENLPSAAQKRPTTSIHRSRSEPNSPLLGRNQPLPAAASALEPPKVPEGHRNSPLPLLFQIQIQQEALRILASTTTGSAVRLDTSRLAIISTNLPNNADSRLAQASTSARGGKREKSTIRPLSMNEFGSVRLSAQIDVMLALGQLVKSENMLYEEAEPDFQPMALFKSRLQVSNHVVFVKDQRASADVTTPLTNSKQGHYGPDGGEITPNGTANSGNANGSKQENRVLAVLQHPYLYTQPRAADTALWFYFNYRSAYQSFVSQRKKVDKSQNNQLSPDSAATTPEANPTPKRFAIDPKDVALATLRRKSTIKGPRVAQRSVDVDDIRVTENDPRSTEQSAAAAAVDAGSTSTYTAVVFQFLVYQAQICIPLQSAASSISPRNNTNYASAMRLNATNAAPVMPAAVDHAADGADRADDVEDIEDSCYSPALLISLNSARVKALWTDESVVTTGQFDKFTMHFSDDQCGGAHFEHIIEPSMVAVLEVPQGTAQLCSRSVSEQQKSIAGETLTKNMTFAKWFVQIKWNMHGIVLNVDTNIGRNISALVETLASMASKQIGGGGVTASGQDENEVDRDEENRMEKQNSADLSDDVAAKTGMTPSTTGGGATTPDEIFSDALTDFDVTENATKNRAQLEREMVTRASRLQSMMVKRGGKRATEDEIEAETRRLHKIEAQLSYDVRRDVFGRLAQRKGGPTSEDVAADPKFDVLLLDRDSENPTFQSKKPKTVKLDLPLSIEQQQQPHVELDLAVIVLIDSGKCNFYMRQVVSNAPDASKRHNSTTNDDLLTKSNAFATTKTQQNVNKLQLLRDRLKLRRNNNTSTAKTSHEPTHQSHVKRSSIASTLTTGTVGGGSSSGLTMAEQLTSTLHLPGITMRAHYKSQNTNAASADNTVAGPRIGATVVENDRSSLHAVMTLLSMPEETRVSPKMLDFVEQVLQRVGYDQNASRKQPPPPSETGKRAPKRSLSDTGVLAADAAKHHLMRENSAPSTAASGAASTATSNSSKSEDENLAATAGGVLVADNTFPIDVYFCLKVRPSVIRCFCEPVSKVQALVQLPSLEVMLSSKNSSVMKSTVAAGGTLNGEDESENFDANAFFEQGIPRRNLPGWAERLQNAATSSNKTAGNVPKYGPGAAESDDVEDLSIMSAGGISATAVISDFALIIFHPYGTMPPPSILSTVATGIGLAGKTGGETLNHRSETFASFGMLGRDPGGSSSGGGGAADFGVYSTTRKELLRLQVDAIRIHLSRWKAAKESAAKRTIIEVERRNAIDVGKTSLISPIRFTCILNIGKTSFQYDMRRLPEIMAFPKAFYRKSILRRFFLGDESGIPTKNPTNSDQKMPSSTSVAEKTRNADTTQPSSTGGVGGLGTITEQDESISSPNETNRTSKKLGQNSAGGGPMFFSEKTAADHHKRSLSKADAVASAVLTWKTLVSVSLNISSIDVHMNIGNVLGATLLSIENFTSLGRFSAASDGHRNMYISGDCHRLLLESKGGIIGTLCTLSDLEAFGHVQRDPRTEPRNMIGFKLRRLETRFDYMAATSMMMRLSMFELTAADKWNIAHLAAGAATPAASTTKHLLSPTFSKKFSSAVASSVDIAAENDATFSSTYVAPPSMHINTSASWDQFQVILCSTSTSDMVRAIYKLREFGREQVMSGKKFIVSVTGDTAAASAGAGSKSQANATGTPEAAPVKESRRSKKTIAPPMPLPRNTPNPTQNPAAASAATSLQAEEERIATLMHDPYHRYWPRSLKLCAGKAVKTLIDCVFPASGTVLGGTCEMYGQHMSIACFYGSSFRAKSWARFSVKSPQATFSVEAHEVMNDETKRQEYHIVQNLSFRLGKDEQSRFAATISRVSCQGSPAVKSFHEWFAFVFHDSDLDEVNRFPKSSDENSTTNIHLFKHVKIISEMILGLPRVDVNLRTEHWHTLHVPTESGDESSAADRPKVIVNFMTDFGAPISIDMGDSQAFYFLHQLIQSYLSMSTDSGAAADGDGTSAAAGSSGNAFSASTLRKQKTTTSNSLSSDASNDAAGGAGGAKFVPLPTELLKVDRRVFECRQWYMEPQVKLLQRIGRDIEPYGVDRVLQRLGFEHARSTIPKWIQRGLLDPLDSLTAAVATQLILRNMRKPPPAGIV